LTEEKESNMEASTDKRREVSGRVRELIRKERRELAFFY